MAENTEISWADHTANLWWGCTEVHEGCDNCYARNLARRWGFEVWGAKGVRRIINGVWKDLAKYQRKAAEAGVVRTVFVGSMMDIFEKPMALVDDKGEGSVHHTTGYCRQQLFDFVDQGKYPNLLFLFLTKRPSNINKYIPEDWQIKGAPSNVMFGTSVVNQETADKLIPELLKVKGRRFLSCEPLLGPISFRPKADGLNQMLQLMESGDASRPAMLDGIHWVIVGGESGQNARPMHPDWARSLRDQCEAAGVSFHFKQWGEYLPYCQLSSDLENATHPGWPTKRFPSPHNPEKLNSYFNPGKKAAGRLLDGKEYNGFPEIIQRP